jgi:GNAT superfamily N-acetyltransferase
MTTQPPVEIVAVQNRSDKKKFLSFPWQHYEGDPNWVPPLRGNQREMVNYRRHPFYNEAEIQTFLASREGKIVGRIAAIVDHAHNRYHKEQRGMFGFFESVNDRLVSDALFDACRDWFSGRGIQAMRGPLNPSMNYECGLLIEGFDTPPTFMMTYNPDYYQSLVEGYGFEKTQDLFAYYGHVDMLETLDEKMHFVSGEAIKRFKLKLRKLDTRHFVRDVRTFLDIYNKSLPGQWGFVPLSDGELQHMAGGLKHLIVPEMTSIAEDESGPVGVVFGLLDYNPLIRQIDGRLFPFGFLTLMRKRKLIKRIRLISTNVVPQYQKWGLGLVLMARMIPDAIGWGVVDAEFSWVLETNKLSRGTLERGGSKRIKTYRIFDYQWQ